MPARKSAIAIVLAAFLCLASARAQQTVFNVPSGDVLDRGKVYGELDVTYRHSDGSASFLPRIVVGLGHGVEAGLNLNGFGFPGTQQITPAPTVKWKFYDGKSNGWAWLAGDDVFLPLVNRTYSIGNYAWTELTHTWPAGTRVTFGAYHATAHVFSPKQRAGGQFAFEHPLHKRVTFATDWYTGASSVGFVTPGLVVKVMPKLTWYGSYQIGNRGVSGGNHQFLFELGWNFN